MRQLSDRKRSRETRGKGGFRDAQQERQRLLYKEKMRKSEREREIVYVEIRKWTQRQEKSDNQIFFKNGKKKPI